MDTITDMFNSQAYANIFMVPLWILLLFELDEARDKRKRKRLNDQFRRFARKSRTKQRQQYQRQIQAHCPAPQYRVTSPHF